MAHGDARKEGPVDHVVRLENGRAKPSTTLRGRSAGRSARRQLQPSDSLSAPYHRQHDGEGQTACSSRLGRLSGRTLHTRFDPIHSPLAAITSGRQGVLKVRSGPDASGSRYTDQSGCGTLNTSSRGSWTCKDGLSSLKTRSRRCQFQRQLPPPPTLHQRSSGQQPPTLRLSYVWPGVSERWRTWWHTAFRPRGTVRGGRRAVVVGRGQSWDRLG